MSCKMPSKMPDPVDPLSVNSTTFPVSDNMVGALAGSYSQSADGRTVMFVPNAPYGVGRTITVGSVGITDVAGNRLANTCCGNTLQFTTSFAPDTTAPQVTQVSPENGVAQAPINSQLMVLFNEPIQAQSIDQVTLRAGGAEVPIGRVLSNGNQTLLLAPATPLLAGTQYTISIGAVLDLAGNSLAATAVVFQTGGGADLIQPTATAVPMDGSTAVGTNVVVAVQFSEPINPVSALLNFRLNEQSSFTAVPGTLTLSLDRRALTFAPFNVLATQTRYVIVLSGITDLAGNALANNYYQYGGPSFTTGQ